LHPSWVAKPSIGLDDGGNVTSAGWQVTLYDPIWHVREGRTEEHWRSDTHKVLDLFANCCTPFTYLFTYLLSYLYTYQWRTLTLLKVKICTTAAGQWCSQYCCLYVPA